WDRGVLLRRDRALDARPGRGLRRAGIAFAGGARHGARALFVVLHRGPADIGLRQLPRGLPRGRDGRGNRAQAARLRRHARSSRAYSSASHLTPASRKLTWTRASSPRPSASMITPTPNLACLTLWPMRQPGTSRATTRVIGGASSDIVK